MLIREKLQKVLLKLPFMKAFFTDFPTAFEPGQDQDQAARPGDVQGSNPGDR